MALRQRNNGRAAPVPDDEATSAFYAQLVYPGPDALITTVWGNRLKRHITDPSFLFLDAGCGSGRHLAGMLKTFPSAHGTGIDISSPSLEQAGILLDRLGFRDRADLQRASFSGTLPFGAVFDVVIASGTIHHSPDPAASLKNLAAVMKPGALFACMVYGERGHRRRYEVKEALQLLSEGDHEEIFRSYLQYSDKYGTWRDMSARQSARNIRRRLGRWRGRLFGRSSAWGYDPSQKSRVFVLDAYAAPIDRAFNTRQLRDMLEGAGLELVEMLNLGRVDESLLPAGWESKVRQLSTWDQIRIFELLDPMPESLTFLARKKR